MADKLKVPPHSPETEESVLGSLLLDRDAVVAVVEFLRPEHFYEEKHGQIFSAILELYQEREPVDLVTVAEKLKTAKNLSEIGGREYLAELVNKVPTAAHAESYARVVRDMFTKRQLISAAQKLMEMGFDEGIDTREMLDTAEQKVFSLAQQHLKQVFTPVRDILAESFDRLDELHKTAGSLRGAPTGFQDLDDTLAGMQDSNLLILAARPGVGKCVAGDTMIVDPETGLRQTIADLVVRKQGKVLALDGRFKLVQVAPLAFVDDGEKPVYEIITALGNKLEATAVHPLLTIEGWKRVEELATGVRIGVPRIIDCFGMVTWESWRIKSLAYFLGDGGLTNATPRFTNGNPVVLRDFTQSVKEFGGVRVRLEKQSPLRERTPTLVVIGKDQYHKSLTRWLSEVGVMGKLAVDKEIPAEVFGLDRGNISLFLNRLYACEGSVILRRGKGTGIISFASSSYRLAEQVKHLLLRFGVITKLRQKRMKYKDGFRIAYEVEILGAEDILTFAREVGIFGKEKKLAELTKLAMKKMTTKNFTKDTLPMELWKQVLEDKRELTWREVYRRMGRPLAHNIHVNRRELRRETLKEIAMALKSDRLMRIAESDVYWDRVVSIKPVGKKRVYDLSVDGLHNFVAGDIVVHNTALALNIAQNMSFKHKLPVGFFSLEMSREELMDRLLVAQAEIDAWKLKTGRLDEGEFTKLSDAMGELYETPLYIDDTPGASILEMRTKARRLQAEHGLRLIIVDYLQLARPVRNLDNRVQEVSEISQGLKNLARELKIPVLALSQLSRQVESRGIKKPQLADLRESGAIEQDADVVMFMWRENDENLEDMNLDIAKHRNGPLKSLKLRFKGDRLKFYSVETKRKG